MKTSRRTTLFVLAALGCAAAVPAFARGHVSVSVGVAVPGVSIGYSDYHYGHRGYWRGGYWVPAPAYYYPPQPPRVVYEEPVVVERPVYVRRVYEYDGPVVYRERAPRWERDRRWHERYEHRGRHHHRHDWDDDD